MIRPWLFAIFLGVMLALGATITPGALIIPPAIGWQAER
jgi:hypothetical protein